jgi:Mg2+-importing ATPase
MLQRPQKWNIGLIKRFMYVFGAQSSVFDYLTFGLLLLVFKVQASEFRTAWFIESVLTEVLILLIIRTSRRAWQSRPSPWLLWSGISVIVITLTLPYLPVAPWLGFEPLPLPLLAGIGFIALMYGGLSELLKSRFLEKSRTG